MGRNDRLIVGMLAVVLGSLLWVAWMVRDIRRDAPEHPMVRTTEWTTPSGKVEQFQSSRRGEETFTEFRLRHEDAVRELIGG